MQKYVYAFMCIHIYIYINSYWISIFTTLHAICNPTYKNYRNVICKLPN